MSSARDAIATYVEQDVRTETPLALVSRVYDLVHVEIRRARHALDERDWAAKGRAVNAANRGLSLLQCSLDLDRGGDVAANLDRIYTYLITRLSEAHANHDVELFDELAERVSDLAGAWREIARRQPSAPPAVRASAGAEAQASG